MNTKPVFELHPGLDHLDPQEKNTLNTYSAGIDELVSFGTHVLSWGLEATNGRDEVIPQLMIFRNILENLDAISVLVRAGSIDPCKSLLRVVLESVLNLEFMLQGAVERNGLAFLICNYHSENKLTEKLTPGKEQFKQLRSKLRADRSLPDDILPPNIEGLPAHRENLQSLMVHPLYKEVETEYQRSVSSGTRNLPGTTYSTARLPSNSLPKNSVIRGFMKCSIGAGRDPSMAKISLRENSARRTDTSPSPRSDCSSTPRPLPSMPVH